MKFKYLNDQNNIYFDISKEELLSLNDNELMNLYPLFDDEDAVDMYVGLMWDLHERAVGFIQPYNPNEDGIDELYKNNYFYYHMNEDNFRRLKTYNHYNVSIFNELRDQLIQKNPSCIRYYNDLVDWKLGANAVDAITHGYTQGEIFKALIECFGKEAVMPVWRKHYIKFADDNMKWRK